MVTPVRAMTATLRPGINIYTRAIDGVTGMMAATGAAPPLRDVAREIAVPLDQLRRVFPDECALLAAMAENAMLLLHHTFIEVVTRVDPDDPVAQFTALADAYVEWGVRYPREFRVIGQMPASIFEANAQLLRYEQSIHELMLKILQRGRELGLVSAGGDLQTFISLAHTYAYGVVSKMLMGDLARWNPGMTDREAARHNLHVFIQQFLRVGA